MIFGDAPERALFLYAEMAGPVPGDDLQWYPNPFDGYTFRAAGITFRASI